MSYEVIESQFLAAEDKGEVSSLLIRPDGAQWLLVLGHGASTNMRHATLQTIAERLADVGIATFRYNFPYAEQRRRSKLKRCLSGDCSFGGRSGAYSGERSVDSRRRALLQRANVVNGCGSGTDRACAWVGVLRLSFASVRKAFDGPCSIT